MGRNLIEMIEKLTVNKQLLKKGEFDISKIIIFIHQPVAPLYRLT